jgi:hypothetical protein
LVSAAPQDMHDACTAFQHPVSYLWPRA